MANGTDKARQETHTGTDTQAVFPHRRGGEGILTPLREDILRGDNQGMPAEYRDDRLHSRDDNETIRRWQDVDTTRGRYTTYLQWL